MAFRDIVPTIRPAVVGLGLLADESDPFSIVIMGTGFIVHPSGWIMTNRHVAELLMGERNGQRGVRNALARAALFVQAAGQVIPGRGTVAVGGFGVIACPIQNVAMPPEAPDGAFTYESAPDRSVSDGNRGT